jgi:hypothetical protein
MYNKRVCVGNKMAYLSDSMQMGSSSFHVKRYTHGEIVRLVAVRSHLVAGGFLDDRLRILGIAHPARCRGCGGTRAISSRNATGSMMYGHPNLLVSSNAHSCVTFAVDSPSSHPRHWTEMVKVRFIDFDHALLNCHRTRLDKTIAQNCGLFCSTACGFDLILSL